MGSGRKAGAHGKRVMMTSFKFYNYTTLDSTNNKARELTKKGEHDIIVISERQTKGKGRFNRKWLSEPGGLYMTIAIKIKDIDKIKYLTFIASLSVSKTIRKLAKLNAMVKWPNDVLIGNKKICGILTEIISGRENYALIGIGANINQKKFPGSIYNKTTSLKLKTNKRYNIKKISESIIKEFSRLYSHYNKKNYKKITDEWKRYSHTLGKKIMVKTTNKTYIGNAAGIDEDCSLLLKLNNGRIKRIIEGDIFTV